jgi:3-hydroxyisobutyrate dehydrogenase-like beta-hydroxyacid dehydrogenase
MSSTSVTLLGTGKMGAAFVARWTESGRQTVVWNRTLASAETLRGPLVDVASDAATAAAASPVVVSIVTNGDALRSIAIDQGVLAAMQPGSVFVDLSTVDVASSEAVALVAQERGIEYLRGAVSGTPTVVRSGNASLLLSGPKAAFRLAHEVLAEAVPTHAPVGEAEEARVIKIAVNLMLAGTMELLAEATLLAEASGVPREKFLETLESTVISSRFVSYKGAALNSKDYKPTFTTRDMRKDTSLALGHAASIGASLPIVAAVQDQLTTAIDQGYSEDDFLTLFCVLQKAAGLAPDIEH